MCKTHEQKFHQDIVQMGNKHKKRCSTSLAFREMQINTSMRYHYTVIRMDKIKISDHTKH